MEWPAVTHGNLLWWLFCWVDPLLETESFIPVTFFLPLSMKWELQTWKVSWNRLFTDSRLSTLHKFLSTIFNPASARLKGHFCCICSHNHLIVCHHLRSLGHQGQLYLYTMVVWLRVKRNKIIFPFEMMDSVSLPLTCNPSLLLEITKASTDMKPIDTCLCVHKWG